MESSAQLAQPHAPPLRLVRDPAETLPDPLSSFIGRDTELAEIARALDSTRLVTLTGAGGSGKTRLAIEAARRRHAGFADGICWAELAPVDDPALLAAAVLSALGERAQSGRAATTQLCATLADRELLLVLDNCEHIVAECAELASQVLRAAPRVRLLATSREALGVPGERVWPVPTLPAAAAVTLFEERARAVSPSFKVVDANAAAVAEVCRRLDGLPLAIELAAARVSALTPEEIAARLDDCFRLLGGTRRTSLPHQQTLRATIDWSYALLSTQERVLLARLSVFAGGCTLAAAEAVCAGDAFPAADVLAHLCSLVDRSLVVAEALGGSTRYRLLETVRQYGTERLDAAGQADDVRRRHAEYFATTVASAETGRYGLSRDALAESLRPELDNVRAALWWSGEHDQDLFVRLVFGFGWCYFVFGLWWEGRRNFERALELPRGRRRDVARARALNDLAYMASYQYELERARVALEEAVSICEELGEERERAHAIQTLAQTYNFIGTPEALDTALRLAEEAGRVLRAAEDWMGACWASCSLGTIHGARGDGARALAAYDEGRRLAAKANQPMSVAIGCMGMASILVLQGELPRAAGLLREALAAHRKAPEFMFLAWTVEATAMLAAARGQLADAIRLLGADQTLRRQAGAVISIETAYPQIYAQIVGGARQALGDAAFEATLDEGRRLDVEGTISLAESVAVPEVSGASAVNAGATVQSERARTPCRVVRCRPCRAERHACSARGMEVRQGARAAVPPAHPPTGAHARADRPRALAGRVDGTAPEQLASGAPPSPPRPRRP
jgi:non-specific serine/threonine protein kinase